jgi:hypothetical protein
MGIPAHPHNEQESHKCMGWWLSGGLDLYFEVLKDKTMA